MTTLRIAAALAVTLGLAAMPPDAAMQRGQIGPMAKQDKFDVGFPSYRVLLYNPTNQAATVSFFVCRRRD
jgi:hypothetical protein